MNMFQPLTVDSSRSPLIAPALQQRCQDALNELDKLLADSKDFPINYNHYYMDTVHMKRQQRMLEQLGDFAPADEEFGTEEWENASAKDVIKTAVSNWGNSTTADMEDFSCEEALDCLLAIYQVRIIVHFSSLRPIAYISLHRRCYHSGHRATHRPRSAQHVFTPGRS